MSRHRIPDTLLHTQGIGTIITSASRCARALTAVLLATALPAQQPHTLSAGNARIALSPTGQLTQLRLGARTIALQTDSTAHLWIAHPSPRDSADTPRPITPRDAGRLTTTPLTGARAALRLTWDRFARAPDLVVTATVTLDPRDGTSRWQLALAGLRSTPLDSVRFPRIVGIPRLGSNEVLVVPQWMGQRMHDPRARFAATTAATTTTDHPLGAGSTRRQSWAYPGALSVQTVAITADPLSLRLSADDSLAHRKSFTLAGASDGTLTLEHAVILPDPGRDDRYTLPYHVGTGLFVGDWITLAEWYRPWAMRQRWARESRVARGLVAPWVDTTGIWVWNRGRSPMVLDPAVQLQSLAKLPVSVFWHWWHKGPYDTSFPDYLPPREGAEPFTRAVRAAQQQGVHAIVYMNQRLWCTATPSWTARDAQQGAVRERDGRLRLETYNIFDPIPCATMSVTSPFWRNTYAGIADTVVDQYGIDGIYMDQAVLSLVNWRRGSNMPVGGGNYWMAGFDSLAAQLRATPRGRPLVLAGEGGGESWLPALDLFLTLQVSQERYSDPANGWEPLPLFQAIYHEVATTYGTYGSLTYPPYDELWPDSTRPANALTLLDRTYAAQFRLEQARMFVWGMQPTIANLLPEQFTARKDEIDYLIRLARLRQQLPAMLHRGRMLRPPPLAVSDVRVRLSRISIYAARRGGPTEAELRSPAVLHGSWRASDGRIAIPVASIVDTATTSQLTLSPAALGVRPGAILSWLDERGARDAGVLRSPLVLPVSLPPQGAAVLLITPPSS
jgi:hypothetical protein